MYVAASRWDGFSPISDEQAKQIEYTLCIPNTLYVFQIHKKCIANT